jgi:cytochrome c biogenesis protein CcdA
VQARNRRKFLKAALVITCGVALVINSGTLKHSLTNRFIYENPAAGVQAFVGMCLIVMGMWFHSRSGNDSDPGNGAG